MDSMNSRYVQVTSFEDPFGIKEFLSTQEGKEFKKRCEMASKSIQHENLAEKCEAFPCQPVSSAPINMPSSELHNETNVSTQTQNPNTDAPNNPYVTQENDDYYADYDSSCEYETYDDYDPYDDYDCYRGYTMEDSLMDALDDEPDAYWNIRD